MKIFSLLLNILNIGVLSASVVSLLPTAMIFDAPGSENKKSFWFLAGVFVLFPLVAMGSSVTGWSKWSASDYQSALKCGAVAPAYAALCLKRILD